MSDKNKKTKRITIRLNKNLYDLLSYVSETTGLTKSEVIRTIIVNYYQMLEFLRKQKRELKKIIKI